MSNPDVNCQSISKNYSTNDYSSKNEICLFNFSNLKSSIKLSLSQNNSLNYDFSKIDQNELKNERKETSHEKDISHYIKKVNIDIPSPKKLLKEENKNKFLNEYNDSFAHFCGLSKEQYIEVYINNEYKPILNEFGNINISIKNILDTLNDFSSSKRVKITRRMHKKNRMKNKTKSEFLNLAQNKSKNKFIITKLDIDKETKESKPEYENNQLDSKSDNIDKDKSNNENSSSIISGKNYSENNTKNENKKRKTLLSIKKKLKNISIPDSRCGTISSKEKSLESSSSQQILNKENLNSNNNNDNNFQINNDIININKENKKISSASFENRFFIGANNTISNQILSNNLESANNNNNNIFNFSSNIIQNYSNNSQNKNKNEHENDIFGKQPITPFNNNNNNNNDLNTSQNNNLNENNRPMLSPLNLSLNFGNILSPNIYHLPKNEMLSPFFQNLSPFNGNDINDFFLFNNNTSNNPFLFGNNINENANNKNN